MEGRHLWLDEMEDLVNMRYIYCYNQFSVQSVNASLYKLRNLQTMVYLEDRRSIKLSPEIWKMPHLRHVKLNGYIHLPDPPSSEIKGEENSIVVLENLQTLSILYNFGWTEEVLKRIPNLKKLAINYDNLGKDWENYYMNNLSRLTKLESLKCRVGYNHKFPYLLRCITFPTSLKKLTLYDMYLYYEDLTILGSMPCLGVLKLKGCNFDCGVWEPNEEEFLELKYLLLHNVDLKSWRADSIHFPSLESLVISVLLRSPLDEIPSGFGEISTLQSIELHGCVDSIVESAKKIVEQQLDWGNDAFKLYIK
ncbi:putative late blight resistance protein homolog R1B-8 [Olea europaea var. sylvestris]|uniref:putative late blight resistance protein homolog R1B-8 n=1 Tax=Olea europaea var. sylvestris TaxID=158386 RepID=UPI000C1D845C|nr:putative late blight resistance protein homolog R1B-8 [Olea europaea var. sylvestris]